MKYDVFGIVLLLLLLYVYNFVWFSVILCYSTFTYLRLLHVINKTT